MLLYCLSRQKWSPLTCRKLTFKDIQVNKNRAGEFQEGMGITNKIKGVKRTECLLWGSITLALCWAYGIRLRIAISITLRGTLWIKMGAGKCGREVRTPDRLGGKGLTVIPVWVSSPLSGRRKIWGKRVPHPRAFWFLVLWGEVSWGVCAQPAVGLLGHMAVLFPTYFKESPHCSP